MAYDRKDHYWRLAKREGKASRAAYKFEELQRRFRLVKRGGRVVDLGCSPGGWLAELAGLVGPKGLAIGVDTLPLKIALPHNARFVQRGIEDKAAREEVVRLADGGVDAVLSDMSPNLSGIAFADAARSHELATAAFEACRGLLKSGGNFAVKVFPGDEFRGYVEMLKGSFSKVTIVTPRATRKASSERYVVAVGYRWEV